MCSYDSMLEDDEMDFSLLLWVDDRNPCPCIIRQFIISLNKGNLILGQLFSNTQAHPDNDISALKDIYIM